MIQISEDIQFNPELKFQEQSPEFQAWINEHFLSKEIPAEKYDELNRPLYFYFEADGFGVTLTPKYKDNQSWAMETYLIDITPNPLRDFPHKGKKKENNI